MGKNGNIKKMNMKVAGTLGNYLSQKVNSNTGELEDTSKRGRDVSQADDKNEDKDNKDDKKEVWDQKLFEGLTSKQKKNLRKKLQRQRKKKENLDSSQADSSVDLSERQNDRSINDEGQENPMGEIDNIDIDVGDKAKDENKILDDLQADVQTEDRTTATGETKQGQTLDEMKKEF